MRRAAIISHRDRQASARPTSFPLGNVFPLPFRPLSTSSRKKVRQTLTSYCSSQSLQLHAVILTPVFAMPSAAESHRERSGSRHSREHFHPPSPPSKSPCSTSEAENEWDDSTEMASSDELVSLKALLPLPTVRHKRRAKGEMILPLREGSYVVSR